ncbi:MAG: hypothetical protein E7456_06100 [Ruminococcaceae bacterium]|nr:hypothetical protein [Oscillospiraceae bacterium]
MKRIICITLSMLILTGCSAQTSNVIKEPDELEMIRTIGIDLADDGYSVTIGTGVGLDGSPPTIRSGEGVTIDEALNVLKKTSRGQEPFYSHTEDIIISEDVARAGIQDVIDFMARNSEMRIGTNILIAKGAKAQDIMTGSVGGKTGLTDMIEVMEQQITALGAGYMFTCLDVAAGLAQGGSALMLAVELVDGDNLLDEKEKKLQPVGFGIFEDSRLKEFSPYELSPGITFLMDKLESINIEVETDMGTVGLALTDSKVDYQPVFLDDQLQKLKITLETEMSITEAGGVTDLTSEKRRQEVGLKASEQILANLQETLKFSKELGTDFMAIGEKVELKAPFKYEKIQNSWQERFSELEIELEVKTVLKRSYDMADPIRLSGGKNE